MKNFKKYISQFARPSFLKIRLILFFSVLVSIAFLTNGCKKSALTGDNSEIVGEWAWKDGFQDEGNTSWRLIIQEKGKYKLSADGKKIETGRILKVGDKLECHSNALVPKGYLDNKNLILRQTNELKITRIEFTDQPVSLYQKVK